MLFIYDILLGAVLIYQLNVIYILYVVMLCRRDKICVLARYEMFIIASGIFCDFEMLF